MAERQREYAHFMDEISASENTAPCNRFLQGTQITLMTTNCLSTEQMFSMATIFAGVRAVRWAVQPQKGDVCMLPAAMAFLLAVKPALHCVLKSAKE